MKLSAVIECSLLASVWMVASVSGDSIRTVALSGQPAAGIGGDLVYDSLDDLPIINNVGQTAFAARLSGGSVNEGNNHGIWLEGGGAGLELVAREGEHAPGLPSGASLAGTLNDEGFLVLNLNDAGQTAFTGRLNDPGVTSINDGGIWSGGGEEGLRLVVRSGFPVPGVTGSDDVYAFLSPTLNSSGKTAFAWIDSVFLAYRGPSSIGSESEGGGVTLLASAGDPAPGTGGGFEFSYFRGPISFNDLGQTAFRGHLDGPVIRSHNDLGIWSEGGGGGTGIGGPYRHSSPWRSSWHRRIQIPRRTSSKQRRPHIVWSIPRHWRIRYLVGARRFWTSTGCTFRSSGHWHTWRSQLL